MRSSVKEVGRWLPWCSSAYDELKAAEYIRSVGNATSHGSEFSFGVFTNDSAESHIGGTSLNRIYWAASCANLGFWMATKAAGRGHGTIAAQLMCRFGYQTLGLHRIEIQVEVGNEGSRRIAEKLGGQLEGTLRQKIRRADGWSDAWLYGLLADTAAADGAGEVPCAC